MDIIGRWRDQAVWVGGSDAGPHQALFVPPHESRVAAAMDDLFEFIERDDIPVLAHVALVEAGVLTQIGTSKRSRRWQAPAVLSELDDFALRAGRRTVA